MADKPSISDIENAFSPAKEISDPDRFAGRRDSVENSYYALVSEGTNISIIGNRGIGKSSLARQVLNIATGNNDLLDKMGISVDHRLDFLPIYFACGNSVSCHHELL